MGEVWGSLCVTECLDLSCRVSRGMCVCVCVMGHVSGYGKDCVCEHALCQNNTIYYFYLCSPIKRPTDPSYKLATTHIT